MAHGRGYGTSGKKGRAGVGAHGRNKFNKGPSMADVTREEAPPNPDAEIEARRSDAPTDELPPDAAAIRRRRRGQK